METKDLEMKELCLELVKKIDQKQRIDNDIKKDLIIILTMRKNKHYISLFKNMKDAEKFCNEDINVAGLNLMVKNERNLFCKTKKNRKGFTMVLTAEKYHKTFNKNKCRIEGFITSFDNKEEAKEFCFKTSYPERYFYYSPDSVISCIVKKKQIDNLHLYFK